jgi:hypothetical protein
MGHVRFTDMQARPTEGRDLTSLTLAEWQRLVAPFDAVFQAPMAHGRRDGPPRPARRYTTAQSCPLPTPEERLLLLLGSLTTHPLQVVPGRLFGMGPSKAPHWIPGL